jgi:hypothetical protein
MVIPEAHADVYSGDCCNQLRDACQRNQSGLTSKMLCIRDFKSCWVDAEVGFLQGLPWRDPKGGTSNIAAWFQVLTSVHFGEDVDCICDRLRGCSWESAHRDDGYCGNQCLL